MVGCGNSSNFVLSNGVELSEEMAVDGFKCIHNLDISAVVLDKMAEKFAKHSPHQDCKSLLPHSVFDRRRYGCDSNAVQR